MRSETIDARLSTLERQLASLLDSPVIPFDDRCRSALPEEQGIYRIFDPRDPGVTIRAGRTKTAAAGLRQRVYQNHLMGNQQGNLRAQLVGAGVCPDLEAFERIVPCGIRGKAVTSLLQILGTEPPADVVRDRLSEAFESVFELHMISVETLKNLGLGGDSPHT